MLPRKLTKAKMQEIFKFDNENHQGINTTRTYAYFEEKGNALLKVIVAVKNHPKTGKQMCKQVVVRDTLGNVFGRDCIYTWCAGYSFDWSAEISGGESDTPWIKVPENLCNLNAKLMMPNLDDTKYKYSGYKECIEQDVDLIEFLKVYEKHPRVEMLAKAGLAHVALYPSVVAMLEKDKQFAKWLCKNAIILAHSKHKYTANEIKTAYKHKADPRDIAEITKYMSPNQLLTFLKTFKVNDFKKMNDYVAQQHQYMGAYLDYLHACKYLGVDMSDTKNLYPKDFAYWHRVRIDQYSTDTRRKKYLKELIDFSETSKKFEKLELKDEYTVVIARTKEELIYEGEVLQHCVGSMNYDQRMKRKESLIFFIRNNDAPNVPYVTIEFSLLRKEVLQCYGRHDSKPAQDVLDFVYGKWSNFARQQLSRIAA